MIDMHSHVLPAIDDGAKDAETSVSMLSLAKKQGVTVCCATPHFTRKTPGGAEGFTQMREKSFDMLKSCPQFQNADLPEIVLGAEVHLDYDISENENIHMLCYENTDYMLVELSSVPKPAVMAEWVYNLTVRGIKPVMAHIDRYPFCIEMMDELIGVNVVYQVNASRFLNMSGRHVLNKLFKRNEFFFASSDMHNMDDRACNMLPAFQIAKKKYGDMCDELFNDTAQKILKNSEIN